MSLFGYYAWHSFKNQLKKIFKSWVLIFIVVCMLIGGLIGAGAASLSEMAEQQNQNTETEQQGELPEIPIEDPEIEIPKDPARIASVTEGIAGVAILGLLLLFIKDADKNGSAIFLPADVTLLFTSPMKPQSVLAFRVMCTIGLVLFTSIYMLFQIPNLVLNAGMTVWQALSLLLAWFFVFLFGQIIKIFLYTLCSTRSNLKKYITPGIITVLGLFLAGYAVFHLTSGLTPFESALAYVNGGISRYIPIWGWTKGIVGSAFEGSLSGVLLYCGLNILAASLIVVFTWNMKADFYEDAMARSEETAALQREVQESGGLYVRRRKKDRSEKLLRDGFRHGNGANVYFFKSMYNRRRFAIGGILTKTCIFYLAAALGISLLFMLVFKSGNGLNVTAMALGVMVFYRALGNPLEADTQSQYFVLIPEPVTKKIFFSLLGSTVNCMLDALPAMILACVLLKGNPVHALAWMLFIASIDAYSTIVGAFLGMSVPTSIGVSVKQMVQIMFIYFGLLPDIALIAVGIVMNRLFTFALISVALNAVLIVLFTALSSNFISPRSGRVEGVSLSADELKTGKRTFSVLAFVPLIMAGVTLTVQVIYVAAQTIVYGEPSISGSAVWLLNFIPMYAVGLPLGLLAIRNFKPDRLEQKPLGIWNFFKVFTVSLAFMYAGNIIGNLITSFIGNATGQEVSFDVGDLITGGDKIWIMIFVVIIGPIVEEFVFRKLMIDRLSKYGMSLAVVFSSVAFGLFHGNLNQFFYATALGLIFGYVYVKTGRLRYTIALHMLVNFLGSMVATFFLDSVDMEALENMDLAALADGNLAGFAIYILVMLGLAVTGLIIFFANLKKIELPAASMPIKKELRFRTAFLSLGFICLFIYFVLSTALTVASV